MRRGWKITLGILAALVALVAINAVITSGETKSAEVTVPGGTLLELSSGAVQVTDTGPRDASPIVLVHCFTCSINWWNEMTPRLARKHRVIAIDLLGHGGSEKPESGYSIPNQAKIVAEAMHALGVRDATVVGHSLGGAVAVSLADQFPRLVNRVAIIGTISEPDGSSLGPLAGLAFKPVIGETLWRIKPDFAVRKGLEVAFAPGFDVPDMFVEDVNRMTFSSYKDSSKAFEDYIEEKSLADRYAETGKQLMVIMGEREQIIADPRAALDAYQEANPEAVTTLLQESGHSPNVEEPVLTAELINGFDEARTKIHSAVPPEMQKRLQKRNGVRQGS